MFTARPSYPVYHKRLNDPTRSRLQLILTIGLKLRDRELLPYAEGQDRFILIESIHRKNRKNHLTSKSKKHVP